LPCELILTDHAAPLYCEKLARIIPGKRAVVFGKWQNQDIVAKLFYGSSKAKLQAERDAAGSEILSSSQVPTPKLYCQTTVKNRNIHVLIFERIKNAISLDDLWQNKNNTDELLPFLDTTIIELATQHVLGILQKDLHLKNFVFSGEKIYSIDGGSIQKFPGPLPKKESLNHLALFFSQLGLGTQELQQRLFDIYVKLRGWIVKPQDIDQLNKMIYQYNRKRLADYRKKIWRNCSAFKKVTTILSNIIYDKNYQTNHFLNILKHPKQCFANQATILKAGRSSTVAKVVIDGKTFIIKRYNIKNIWHFLRRFFRPTRAAHSWHVANQLWLMGVATAKPIATIEKRFLGIRATSYFIMKPLEGMHLGEYFADFNEQDPRFLQMAQRVVSLFNHLLHLKLSHGDLKTTNIIVHNEQPWLIDLDGVKKHMTQFSLKRAFKKDLKRFMRNWENQPSIHRMFSELYTHFDNLTRCENKYFF